MKMQYFLIKIKKRMRKRDIKKNEEKKTQRNREKKKMELKTK